MSKATANIPETGGTVVFSYTFTGTCINKTVDNWVQNGNTDGWFDVKFNDEGKTITVSADTSDGQVRHLYIIPYVNNVQCDSIYITQTVLNCECKTFTFEDVSDSIPFEGFDETTLPGGMKIGAITRSNNLCDFNDIRFEYQGGDIGISINDIELRGDGDAERDIYLTKCLQNQSIGKVSAQIKTYFKSEECTPIDITQNGEEPCNCDNINYSVTYFKTSLPPFGTGDNDIVIASGKSSCGYLEPLINAYMINEDDGNPKVTTSITDNIVEFIWHGRIKPLRPELAYDVAGVRFNLKDKYGVIIAGDCQTSIELSQSNDYCYCDNYDCKGILIRKPEEAFVLEGEYNIYMNQYLYNSSPDKSIIFKPSRFTNRCKKCYAYRLKVDKEEYFKFESFESITLNKWILSDNLVYYGDAFIFKDEFFNTNHEGESFTITIERCVDAVIENGNLIRGVPCDPISYTFTFNNCDCMYYDLNGTLLLSFDDDSSYKTVAPGDVIEINMRRYIGGCEDDKIKFELKDASEEEGDKFIITEPEPFRWRIEVPQSVSPSNYHIINVYVSIKNSDGVWEECGHFGYFKFIIEPKCEDCERDFINMFTGLTSAQIDCTSSSIIGITSYYYRGKCPNIKLEIISQTGNFSVSNYSLYYDNRNPSDFPETGASVTLRAYPVNNNDERIFDENCYEEWTLILTCREEECNCYSDTLKFEKDETDIIWTIVGDYYNLTKRDGSDWHPGDEIHLGTYQPPTAECLTFIATSSNEFATICPSSRCPSNEEVKVIISNSLTEEANLAMAIYLQTTDLLGRPIVCDDSVINIKFLIKPIS